MPSIAAPILCSALCAALCAGVLIPQVGAAEKPEPERTGGGVRLTVQSLPLTYTQSTSVTSNNVTTKSYNSGENDGGGQVGLWFVSNYNPTRPVQMITNWGITAARVWQQGSQGVVEDRLYGLGLEMAVAYSPIELVSLEFGGKVGAGWADVRIPETVNGVTKSSNHSNAGAFGEAGLLARAVIRPARGIEFSAQAGYMGLHQRAEFENTTTNTKTTFISRARGGTVGCGFGFVY